MLDQLIAQHGRRLYGLCIKLCGSEYEADDLYQDTWLKVHCNLEKYDESQPFEHWLTAICVNCYRDQLRRSKFSGMLAIFSTNEEKDAAMASVPAADNSAENAELWEAVRRLPEKYRTVIHLFYYEDMSVDDISKALGQNPSTVKSHLHRGRKLLREELEGEYDFV